jgi:phosphoribosylformylglycinamidine cyclo-ligase
LHDKTILERKMKKITYEDSGVNIDEGNKTVQLIKKILKKYKSSQEIGKFGGMFKVPEGYISPYLISSSDGVGTKLKVAIMSGVYDTVGQDLVNHCVDDILVQGAKPLYFFDYFATGKLKAEIAASVIEGFAKACYENDCILLGGETAEMPGFYSSEDFDIAGFITGIAEEKEIIDGTNIKKGDIIIGLPSTGLHTNGYSLARKIFFDKLKMKPDSIFQATGKTVAEELLAIHKSYYKKIFPLRRLINGMAHITGGGFYENIPRILNDNHSATIKINWEIPEIFKFLVKESGISLREGFRTFNMGIGMIVIIDKNNFNEFDKNYNDTYYLIGEIRENSDKEKVIIEEVE